MTEKVHLLPEKEKDSLAERIFRNEQVGKLLLSAVNTCRLAALRLLERHNNYYCVTRVVPRNNSFRPFFRDEGFFYFILFLILGGKLNETINRCTN